jgi:hypothetical protein
MTKSWLSTTSALMLIGAVAAQAQATTSEARIRVAKDEVATVRSTMVTNYAPNDSLYIIEARTASEWYRPTGTTCSNVGLGEDQNVQIKSDLYNASTMISPDQAKQIAKCAVPGQIGSGEMQMTNGRAEYEISIIPNGKKTYTKVIVDAQTGAVLSTKQFGGLRGLTGWMRESFEHKENKP